MPIRRPNVLARRWRFAKTRVRCRSSYAAALFEAFFLTGVVFPGSILVDLGGVLVHRGMLDFVDLLWFVVIGSWIGSYCSLWFGQRFAAGKGVKQRFDPSGSPTFCKALSQFQRHGVLAVLLGRFSGPVAGLVLFAAGLAGMRRRRFLAISAIGAVPYTVVHVTLVYRASEVFAHRMRGRAGWLPRRWCRESR